MYEALVTQELDLPTSNILDYEDRVPLPRFVSFPGVSFASMLSRSGSQPESADLSFCHYHFLSQIAHRRILTRLRNSMFSTRCSGNDRRETHASQVSSAVSNNSVVDYPPQALEDELFHQIEQWRQQLPEALQFVDGNAEFRPISPQDYLVVPWLRARYLIAKYHLRRPLLWVQNSMHDPLGWLTDLWQTSGIAPPTILEFE
jgi:hypothetical protein